MIIRRVPEGYTTEALLFGAITSSAVEFRKSSSSSSYNSNCVEVALARDSTLIRDSKNGSGPVLSFSPGNWNCFLGSAKGIH
jgi:hypothetical protein